MGPQRLRGGKWGHKIWELALSTWPPVQPFIYLTNGSKTLGLQIGLFIKEKLLPFSLFSSTLTPEFWEMGGSHSLQVVISIDLNAVHQPFPADSPYSRLLLPFPMSPNSFLPSVLKPHVSIPTMPLARSLIYVFIHLSLCLYIFFIHFDIALNLLRHQCFTAWCNHNITTQLLTMQTINFKSSFGHCV